MTILLFIYMPAIKVLLLAVGVHFGSCAMWLIDESFALIGLHAAYAAADWLLVKRCCTPEQRRQYTNFFTEFALSFVFAPLRTLRAELTTPPLLTTSIFLS